MTLAAREEFDACVDALGAAGVHEAIYSLLMLEHGFIAPSINIQQEDELALAAHLLELQGPAQFDAFLTRQLGATVAGRQVRGTPLEGPLRQLLGKVVAPLLPLHGGSPQALKRRGDAAHKYDGEREQDGDGDTECDEHEALGDGDGPAIVFARLLDGLERLGILAAAEGDPSVGQLHRTGQHLGEVGDHDCSP